MNARKTERALARLAAPGAMLAVICEGEYGVAPGGDRRRRPTARLDAATVRALESTGTLSRRGDGYVLSDAGRARVRRAEAPDAEVYRAQHAPIVDRATIDDGGTLHMARGLDVNATLKRLAALRDTRGAAWLTQAELMAAAQLRGDWDAAQIGLVRGSDWRAPPKGASPRGGGQDGAMAARCDARRRFEDKLRGLAAPLRRVVERVCLHEEGLEALERAEGWPHRSGKLALKLGLAQLAAR
jgi:hypothetical protein